MHGQAQEGAGVVPGAGTLRCPHLVGRADEQSALTAALDDLSAGHGSAVVITGQAGIGKSRLTRWLADEAASRGHPVMVGGALEGANGPALGPIQEALLGCPVLLEPGAAARLGPLALVLAHIVPVADPPATPPTPTLVGHAVLRGLAEMVPKSVLVLEDVHAADVDTFSVVRHLVAHARSAPVLVVLNARPEGSHGLDAPSGVFSSEATLLPLAPLGPDDVVEVAAALLGCETSAVPAALRDRLASAAGLPLLVEDLVADALANETLRHGPDGWVFTPGPFEVPTRFGDVVKRRVRSLGEPARLTARAAAVLGPALATDGMLAAATGLDPAELSRAVEQCAGAQLLDPDGRSFRHALTRDAVLATTPIIERQRLAGAALDTDGVPAPAQLPVVAEVLVTAGRYDDAAQMLAASARLERRRGAADAACARLQRAQSVARDEALRADLLLELVAVLDEGGRIDAIRDLEGRAATLEPARVADLHMAMATAELRAGSPEHAGPHLDRAGSLLASDDPRRIRWRVAEARFVLEGSDDPARLDRAEALAREAAAAAVTAGDPVGECEAWMIVGRCVRFRDLMAAKPAFERALNVANEHGLEQHRLHAMHEIGTAEMLGSTQGNHLELARREAEATGALGTLASILVNLTALYLQRNEWDRALEVGEEADRLCSQLGLEKARVMNKVWVACVVGDSRDLAEGHQMLDEALDEMGDDPDVRAAVDGIGRLIFRLLEEDRPGVRRIASSTPAQGELMHFGPSWALLLGVLDGDLGEADVHAVLGDVPPAARPSNQRLVEQAARAMAVARRNPAEAMQILAPLRRLLDGTLYGMCVKRHLAEAAMADGWGAPAEWLREVHDRATSLGHPALAARCASMLRSMGQKVPRPTKAAATVPDRLRQAQVTPREYEVLQLLVDLPTNADLSERLHLSVRTVEKHVASLLMKLHVDSRRDLAALAADL